MVGASVIWLVLLRWNVYAAMKRGMKHPVDADELLDA